MIEIIYSIPSIVLSIINSISVSSVVSIILVFFQDFAYRLFGSGVLWDAIRKSSKTDAQLIQVHFQELENNEKLRKRVIAYFEYGIGIFGLYSSLAASTISSVGLIATYPTNWITVVIGISFTVFTFLLFFIFRRTVRNRGIHIYSDRKERNKGLSKWRMTWIIVTINILLIIVGQLAEKNILPELRI
jgi:hypothetical protein